MKNLARPKHFLAFGHSNQATFRRPDIQDCFDGVSVPGTIATYFRQGTGGFVIALDKPYFLDPRTPVFQSSLATIKASFCTLAEAHGAATTDALTRSKASEVDLWETIRDAYDADEAASSWLRYQRDYVGTSSEKLDYYADLIGTDISSDNSQGPTYITAPYWMSTSIRTVEWAMSHATIECTLRSLRSGEDFVPIVAWNRPPSKDWSLLVEMLSDLRRLGIRKVLLWVNNYRELYEPVDQLRNLRTVVSDCAHDGIHIGMLYGGYYSLALTCAGLWAFSNGVGYSESRAFPELSSSGAPPPRYYLVGLHRYLQQAIASRVVADDPNQVLDLPERVGKDPAALQPNDLMAHFVHARGAELRSTEGVTKRELVDKLIETADYVESRPRASDLVDVIHLRNWAAALQ